MGDRESLGGGAAVAGLMRRGWLCLYEYQRRSLSGSCASDHRGSSAIPGSFGRRSRAPSHHSIGGGVGWHARFADDSQQVAVWTGALRNQFDYNTTFKDARLEVLTRMGLADLPPSVQPQIAPTSPVGEIYRYWLRNPVDANGHAIYSLADMKSLQDWTLEREFRRVPRIADVVSFGGRVKRYEVQPDPDRLRRFDITLDQLQQPSLAAT